MAGAATATYTADALMSNGGVNGSQPWDYAVPIGPETQTKSRASNDSSNAYGKSNRHANSNGATLSRSSSQRSKNALGRRDTSQSRAGYDADGSLESYRRDLSASKGAVNGFDSAGNQNLPPKKTDHRDGARQFTEEELNDEYWIHRDKLAKIESEELQQAAIRFQRRVRAGSKSSSRRGQSHDSYSNGVNGSTVTTPPGTEYSEAWPTLPDEKPSNFEFWDNDGNEPIYEERQNWDLRRPEEIAADQAGEYYEDGASKMYRNPGLKKSSSRIPVLAASAVPISQEHIEREFPLLRRRTQGSADAESISYPKPARLSESPNIDTPEASPSIDSSTPPTSTSRPVSRGNPMQTSPAKKSPPKTTPNSGTRKASTQSTTKSKTPQKSRATSGSSTRPTTRGGDSKPATTASRPEGDPPWLATMYKPDPRLPPEQQMLPTHAKRMQQEQWEKEGKTPSTYDREFAPLAVRPDDEKPPQVSSESEKPAEPEQPEQQQQEESSAWPLRAAKSPEPVPLTRPPTNGTGYSTMPKVQNTPPIGIASNARVNPPWPEPQPKKESKEKKKGCGCCIVM